MVKNITLSADEALIRKARQKAMAQHKTLNQEFRKWLADYTGQKRERFDMAAFMKEFSHVDSGGKKYSREERNERR